MRCDLCGSESKLFKTEIEGAQVNVCKSCSGFGKVLGSVEKPKVVEQTIVKSIPKRNEIITMVKSDYPQIIKAKREKMGLKQEELAIKLAEKTSVVHNLETGHLQPSIDLARKFEKFLGVKLVDQYKEEGKTTASSSEGMTIADMIKK